MAAYVGMLSGIFPDIAGHLIAASVMSAPASLVLAKMMVPETETPATMNADDVVVEKQDANVLAAASRGTTEGLTLALNVGAMLVAFIAIVAMLNWMLGALGALVGFDGLTFQVILGWVLGPLAWMLGVPWEDANVIGSMLGTKTVVNEFVAYMELADGLKNGSIQHAKSVVIATYALCGFANFSSIGIQIGGLSAIEPSRRGDLGRLGFRAMIAATLACFQTAAIAGMLL
jgi:CNT family concentrative nucleoside transporter